MKKETKLLKQTVKIRVKKIYKDCNNGSKTGDVFLPLRGSKCFCELIKIIVRVYFIFLCVAVCRGRALSWGYADLPQGEDLGDPS